MKFQQFLLPSGFIVIISSLLLTACSTTRALPDDDQLYTGIKDITYKDDPAQMW